MRKNTTLPRVVLRDVHEPKTVALCSDYADYSSAVLCLTQRKSSTPSSLMNCPCPAVFSSTLPFLCALGSLLFTHFAIADDVELRSVESQRPNANSVISDRGASDVDRDVDALFEVRRQLARQATQIEQLQSEVRELESEQSGGIAQVNFESARSWAQDTEPFEFAARWKHSLWFETPDGQFKANIGGRVEQDWLWLAGDSRLESAVGQLEDGVFFRRARIHGAGTIYGTLDVFAEFEAAPVDNLLFQDAWLQIRELPVVGNFRVGHLLVPFGLENNTSARFITFMERSAVHDAFLQEYDPGMMWWNTELDGNLRWAAAFLRFDPRESGRAFADGEYSAAGRISAVLWSDQDDENLLHAGTSYRLNDASFDPATNISGVRFRARPEFRNTPRFVDTGTMSAGSADFIGAEIATVLGPFFAQAEYVAARVHGVTRNGARVGTTQFSGAYVQAGYFLTGESRKYVRSRGAFGRLIPNNTVDARRSEPLLLQGAWEIAGRLSHVELDDGPISGGRLRTVTVGLNWHLAPNSTIFFDFLRARRKTRSERGTANMFGMRFQVEF